MEKNINLAKILNGKPVNTKLWSPLFGDVYISSICSEDTIIVVNHHGESSSFYNNGKYFNHPESEPLLFPSKKMRDWSKFAWKRGDVLVSNDGCTEIIFDKWYDDTYTSFYGKHYLDSENENDIVYIEAFICTTERFSLEDKESFLCYINTIEEKLGGKLNRETLEIENAQPEFKDWDFITIKLHRGGSLICVFKAEDDKNYYLHANLDSRGIITIYEDSYCPKNGCITRLSTEEEKAAFFDALAKKGKTWDAVKKQIVDLKSKIDELKPFDKVLVKDNPYGSWEPALFWKKVDVKDLHPYMIIGGKRYRYCETYEGNEDLLDN